MEILDPDLWNDDGTPKRPSQNYMKRLREAQDLEAIDPATPVKRERELDDAFLNYARIRQDAKQQRPPEVGDIVHFWGGKEDPTHDHCFAAIVMETESFTDAATIRVHVPHEAFMDWHVDHDEDKGHDTWHWPCGEGR